MVSCARIGIAVFCRFVVSATVCQWHILATFVVPCAGSNSRHQEFAATFPEKYVLDKGQDTYAFTRRSVLKSQTTVGSLSEIRAVQIERTTATTDNETREIFRVALLCGKACCSALLTSCYCVKHPLSVHAMRRKHASGMRSLIFFS